MKKNLYTLLFISFVSANLQSQTLEERLAEQKKALDERFHPDSVQATENRLKKSLSDLTDLEMLDDARFAWRATKTSDIFGGYVNKLLSDLLNFFDKKTGIKIGVERVMETNNRIWGVNSWTTEGSYKKGSSETFMLFLLTFISSENDERQYKIKIEKTDETYGIKSNYYIKTESWSEFEKYLDQVNNSNNRYTRDGFVTAVNDIFSRGLLILIGISDFPLQVDIKPFAGMQAIDSIAYESRNAPYEKIIVGGTNKSVANVAMKVGDELKLDFFVNRMESDNIAKNITLSGKNFNHQLSSFDSVKSFSYRAANIGDDVIMATYRVELDGKTTTELAGKLNISVYEEKKLKVKLIPVNISQSINAGEIQTFLNTVYGQAIVSWNVSVEQSLTVNGFRGNLNADKTEGYNSTMNDIIKVYSGVIEENTYYVFVVNQIDNGSTPGYMPLMSNYGFVAYNSKTDELGRAIAHELGHGAFGLKHTFEDYPEMRERGTDNLMDHSHFMSGSSLLSICRLYQYQWNKIHNLKKTQELYRDYKEKVNYTIAIYEEGKHNPSTIINEEKDVVFAKTSKRKMLDLRMRKELTNISVNWYVDGKFIKQDSVIQIDLSKAGSYDVVVRGISETVLVSEEKGTYTDTLVICTINVTEKPTVKIDIEHTATYTGGDYYKGEFGLDVNTPTSVKNAKNSYYRNPLADAYMSFATGIGQQSAKMEMKVTASSFPKKYKVELKGEELTISPNSFTKEQLEKGSVKFTITPTNTAVDNGTLEVVGSIDGTKPEILYRINYSTKNSSSFDQRKLQVLYVNTGSELNGWQNNSLNNKIIHQLNKLSFNQTFTEWDVQVGTINISDKITNGLHLKRMYDRYAEIYNNFSGTERSNRINQLLNEYGFSNNESQKYMDSCSPNQPDHSLVKKITPETVQTGIMHDLFKIYADEYPKSYIAFVFNRGQLLYKSKSVPAAASTERNDYSSVYLFSEVKDNPSIFTHELGHSLGLKHPFDEFGIPQTNTKNYMDYGGSINMFWYWQWGFIQTEQPTMITKKGN
jgi:predicted Zn-dependent protease